MISQVHSRERCLPWTCKLRFCWYNPACIALCSRLWWRPGYPDSFLPISELALLLGNAQFQM